MREKQTGLNTYYTGVSTKEVNIDGPWNNDTGPALNADNLNRIENALMEFLGIDGVIHHILTVDIPKINEKIADNNTEISRVETEKEQAIASLTKTVTAGLESTTKLIDEVQTEAATARAAIISQANIDRASIQLVSTQSNKNSEAVASLETRALANEAAIEAQIEYNTANSEAVAGIKATANAQEAEIKQLAEYRNEDVAAINSITYRVSGTESSITTLNQFKTDTTNSLTEITNKADANEVLIIRLQEYTDGQIEALSESIEDVGKNGVKLSDYNEFVGKTFSAVSGKVTELDANSVTTQTLNDYKATVNNQISAAQNAILTEVNSKYATTENITSFINSGLEKDGVITSAINQNVTTATANFVKSEDLNSYIKKEDAEDIISESVAGQITEATEGFATTQMIAKVVDADGNIKASSIITEVNADTSGIKLSANHIDIANFHIDSYGISDERTDKVSIGMYSNGREFSNSNGYLRFVAGSKLAHDELTGRRADDGGYRTPISMSSAGRFVVSSNGRVYCENLNLSNGSYLKDGNVLIACKQTATSTPECYGHIDYLGMYVSTTESLYKDVTDEYYSVGFHLDKDNVGAGKFIPAIDVRVRNAHCQSGCVWEPVQFQTQKGTGYTDGKLICKLDGTWVTSAEISVASDRNEKHDITEITDKYSALFDNLSPKLFKYNTCESDRYHTGLIAQEVEKALTDAGLTTQEFAALCYNLDESGNKIEYSIRYGELIALLIREVQILKKKLQTNN